MKKNCFFILVAFWLGLLLPCPVMSSQQTIAPADFQGVIITDSDGSQILETRPGATVRCEAIFSLDTPGLAIIRGTVSSGSWSEGLPPQIRIGRRGTYNVAWTAQVPFAAQGQARADVILLRPFRERLIRTGFFMVTPIEADYVGSDACSTCHKTIHDAWSATLHAPGVGCESCHGPASLHVASPSAESIVVDRTAELCGRCHSRNDGTVIEAAGGFIKAQQQYNEWRATAHGRSMQCATCHDPHYSVAGDKINAIKASCVSCHAGKRVDLNMQFVACESCHMPKAVLSQSSQGAGLYRTGDTAAHLWRIKTEADPDALFTPDGTAVIQDPMGPFLTLNFACLGCHNSRDARWYDFESVQQTSTLVHY